MKNDIRATWLAFARPDHFPDLRSFGIDPDWLDRTMIHRGRAWRIAGLQTRGRFAHVVLIGDDGATATIALRLLKQALTQK